MSKQKSQIMPALRHIFPPDAVIDVGIGTGRGEIHQWRDWDVPLALLVDANPDRVEWVEEQIEKNKSNSWQLITTLLADNEGQRDFFVTSNRAESSVIATKKLQQIWSNMQLHEQQTLSTQRLQSLLLLSSLKTLREASCIWGIIDCLPALPVLQGAGDELKQWSVLWVRVVLSDIFSDKEQQHSSLAVIIKFLAPLGYRCVEVIEENHPALGYALFVQDWQNKVEQLQQVTYSQTKQLEDYKQQCQQLEDYKQQVAKLQQQRKQQKTQIKQLADCKKQITDFQQQIQERDYRQKLLDEEFVKTEAQIELIKDVLLGEKAL